MKKLFLVIIPILLFSAGCKKKSLEEVYYVRITSPTGSAYLYDTAEVKWEMKLPSQVVRFEYYVDFTLSQSFDTVPGKLYFDPTVYSSGTRHSIQLKVYTVSGWEAKSNIVTLTISNLVKPVFLGFTGIDRQSVSFRWSDAGGFETGYRVERKTNNGGFDVIAHLDKNVVQYTDPGLDSLNSYTYRVVAFDNDEESATADLPVNFNTTDFVMTKEITLPFTGAGMIAVDPQGSKCVVTRTGAAAVPIIEIGTGNMTYLAGHPQGSYGVDINNDGTLVATGGYNENTLSVWRISDLSLYDAFSFSESGVFVTAFSSDGQYIAAGGAIKTTVYRVVDGTFIREFNNTGTTRGLAFTKDNSRLLTGGNMNIMELWSMDMGNLLKTYTGHTGHIGKVVFSNDESRIYSGSYEDMTIKRWQTETAQMTEFYADSSGICGLVCLKDDKIAACDFDGNILVFDENGVLKQVVRLDTRLQDMDYCKSLDMLVSYDNLGKIRCYQRTGHWVSSNYIK